MYHAPNHISKLTNGPGNAMAAPLSGLCASICKHSLYAMPVPGISQIET